MCGIVGSLAFKHSSFTVTDEYLTRMRDVMAHRGPDGAGNWISRDGRVGLGHRRLSIIDLSTAAGQPMSNEDGTIWISFNGEIYNHADIRVELEALGGHQWKTDHSDTEVIVHAYEQWGIDCVHRFRGMFAIAIWDDRSKKLWLIRDRIGVKPLYYSVHHGRITFASEIKALLEDPQQPRAVNEEALFHYLSFLTTPAPATLFEGIRKVTSGCWIRVSENGDVEERRYWDALDHTNPLTNVSENEIAERILGELRTAVRLRKVSDVPVGVFLSGGIDSSTNTALFSEGDGQPVRTFAIGYDRQYDSYANELQYARRMARFAHAEYHERILNQQDLIDFLPRMVHLQDEPIADPVCVPLYYVSELARQNGVIVCQVGEGSDELFWGYPSWKRSLRLQELDHTPVPRIFRKAAAGAMQVGYRRSWPREWIRRGAEGQPIFWGGAEVFTQGGKERLLSRRLRRKFHSFTSWEALRPIRQRFEEKAWERADLNWMTYLDLNLRLPELLLARVDKMSMGVSLEGRVPFLDHVFVELAMSIPAAVKTKNGEVKSILKKAVRGLIPDELIDRKKQGFGVPIHEWWANDLGRYAQSRLASFCRETDLFDRREVETLVRPQAGSRGDAFRAWALLNFVMWWDAYIVGDSSEDTGDMRAELAAARATA